MPKEPFELDRLVHELGVDTDPDAGGVRHDLPSLEPLSHEHPHLKAATFDVEDFLLSRAYTSLPDLGSELKEYGAKLKEELVQLINEDYEAFISLSTDLRGEGARLERLHWPLPKLRKEIELSTNELKEVQDAVQAKLQERAAIREEKALLHLLLKISESVQRLENLLLLASPPDESSLEGLSDDYKSPIDDIQRPNAFTASEDDGAEEHSRRGRGKHVARVGAEYMQLLYDAEKARTEGCAFIETLQGRIDRIKNALSSDLDFFFATVLQTLILPNDNNKVSPMEKARLTADLTDCFKTYDLLGAWRQAEEVIRRTIVKPFVRQTVFSGALAVPHSPLMPKTPFPQTTISPMTPSTPFTPFSRIVGTSSSEAPTAGRFSLVLPEDMEDPLQKLYNKLLRFIERDMALLSKHKQPLLLLGEDASANAPLDENRFYILANVVFDEIGRALGDELGSTLFAANYATSSNFVSLLESLAPSTQSIRALRAHPSFTGYQKRWQLPVYFQLRWKEIVLKLEDALSSPTPTHIRENPSASHPFFTAQASGVMHAIETCWGDEVFIPDLGHRFWRMTLQILSRFRTWLDAAIALRDSKPNASGPLQKVRDVELGHTDPLTNLIGTSGAGGDPTATANAAAEDATLKDSAALVADIMSLERAVLELWNNSINECLPQDDETEDHSDEEILRISVQNFSERIPDFSSQIISILTRRCSENVASVRSIPSHFRAMTQRRDVSEPSQFVVNTLRPLRSFLDAPGVGSTLHQRVGAQWSSEVFESVASTYFMQLELTKGTEKSLRRLRRPQRQQTGFSFLGGGGRNVQEEGSSAADERIEAQIVLDVETLGLQAAALGVDVEKSEAYQRLRQSAAAGLAADG
ncbi:COG complex component [Auriculariales sp. MPI-PUGE-AT-0066]|nr:COG complex component [Auriculariales sp. MPI-PUGE-AT-0066]